jgi:hypothetical protein
VSDYGLDDRAIGVRSPVGAKYFSSIPCVQTGSGAHPASCPMGTGGPFPGGKARPGPLTPIRYRGQAPPWRVAGLLYFKYRKKAVFIKRTYFTLPPTYSIVTKQNVGNIRINLKFSQERNNFCFSDHFYLPSRGPSVYVSGISCQLRRLRFETAKKCTN